MSNIGWQLTPSSSVGNDFINEGTEIFKSGKWAFLAREVIQNSLDVLSDDKDKLIMDISIDDVPTSIIPNKENLLKHIEGTLSIDDLPERCMKFSNNAKKLLEDDHIRILKISDYNTDGITGSEKENGDIKSNWNALIYDAGNSQKKDKNSAGSFGTGKNAPFALSGINTVFYVTRDINGFYACEGVAKLFTSYIDGKKMDKKIYFANKKEDESFSALNYDESYNTLDKLFLRKDVGSDVIMLCVDFDKEQTKREIIQSVIENFFIIIYDEKFEINVFGVPINKKTLWDVIEKYCNKPIEYTNSNIKYGFIKQYLSVYSGLFDIKEFNEEVAGAGKLRLLISKGNDISGKWVAMFRNNGMKIFDNNIRTAQQNYSAIFLPGDSDVDRFLRTIENPTHDFFDPEVSIDDATERLQANRRYNQIKNWIRNKIEEYTAIEISENDYLEGMEEYIQLDDSDTESNVVNQPDVEIVQYENKTNTVSPMVDDKTTSGDSGVSDFTPKDGKSDAKKDFKGDGTDSPGKDKHGLVKDYHNKFKFYPKVTMNNNVIKMAFSLDDYDEDNFNVEIESIGEDNSVSDYIPKIIEAIDVENGTTLDVLDNKILNVKTSDTNVISITFDRKFESKYKVNIYKVRSDSNES